VNVHQFISFILFSVLLENIIFTILANSIRNSILFGFIFIFYSPNENAIGLINIEFAFCFVDAHYQGDLFVTVGAIKLYAFKVRVYLLCFVINLSVVLGDITELCLYYVEKVICILLDPLQVYFSVVQKGQNPYLFARLSLRIGNYVCQFMLLGILMWTQRLNLFVADIE
jgi:hypothetical protein